MTQTGTSSSSPHPGPLKTPETIDEGQLQPAVLTTPFKKIAIAFSGGGFRAAAYGLGTLSYLDSLRYQNNGRESCILDGVEFVSSASGGTFTAMLYAMHVRKNLPFKETYRQLTRFMHGQGLLEDILSLINDETKWEGGKSRNFINAFARIYSEKLFADETFGVYWAEGDPPVRRMDVCFNTTELYRGLPFRFQASTQANSAGVAGNNYVRFDKNDAQSRQTLKNIRLGDIAASSSCFPGGFEPILFPKDFAYSSAKGPSLTEQQLSEALLITDYDDNKQHLEKNIGFVDGGVDDNQGLYSAMLADARRRRDPNNGFDLIFVTDVASYFMDAYEAPEPPAENGIREQTLSGILQKPVKQTFAGVYRKWRMALFIVAFLLAGAAGLLVWAQRPVIYTISLVAISILATLLVLLIFLKQIVLDKPVVHFIPNFPELPEQEAVLQVKTQLPALKNFSDATVGSLIKFLKHVPLGILEQILKARLNSILSIVMDVNLKHTRRLIFGTLYGTFHGREVWENRRLFNVIYELSHHNRLSRRKILGEKFRKMGDEAASGSWADDCIKTLTENCEQLHEVAERARTMGTTLWVDAEDSKHDRIRDVIACGQFTACVKLLEYAMVVEKTIDMERKDPSRKRSIELDEQQLMIFNSVKQSLQQHWEHFKTNPYFLFTMYSTGYM